MCTSDHFVLGGGVWANQILADRLQEQETLLRATHRTNLQLIKEHISSAVQELKDEFVDLSPDTGDLESQLTDTVQKQCLGIREELGWKLIQLGQERLKKAKENHATQYGLNVGVDFKLRAPAIAQVCRELRQVASRHEMLQRIQGDHKNRPARLWLIPDRDVVLVRTETDKVVSSQVIENLLIEPQNSMRMSAFVDQAWMPHLLRIAPTSAILGIFRGSSQ
ncbi:hypothetical protein BKA67DRAFT_529364 [Truncatella angustata]|uniref:Uncharacterized protein n=1 Tax=Truncatella angustata TaxID=152316 RepID=A0A9P8UWB5_9PEZI|nr:uncharacterized protein BKA67DRAFT_529364 [Truncatella angustata]KAH6659189.1 hypothetical protein BKA67DRAFT_529364 [Truncatella angustata]